MNYRFKAECKKEKLRDIRKFVSKVLKKQSLPEVQISTLVLAVDEVCANLIIHSHKCNPEEFIELSITIDPDNKIIFDIIDDGAGFDISSYNEPSLREIVKKKRKGGLGLILVRKIMDDIRLINENDRNICRLTKKPSP